MDESLIAKNKSSPFDACDRTCTCQHTCHWFGARKK